MIGARLVPVMCRSRHVPLVVFCVAAATVVLEAVPVEAWVLPVCILGGEPWRGKSIAAGAGILFAMSALYLLGSLGGGEAVGFILETSGLKSIHDYQAAREVFGAWLPLFAGWKGASARDIAVMVGQRGFPSPQVYFPLVAANAFVRAYLLDRIAARARRSQFAVRIAADYAVIWWVFLTAASFGWAAW